MNNRQIEEIILLFDDRKSTDDIELGIKLLESFLDDQKINADFNIRSETSLMEQLAMMNAVSALEMLFERGFKISGFNRGAMNAACRFGHIETVKLLLKQGCDVNFVDYEDKNAMISALYAGDNNKKIQIMQILIDAGVDLSHRCHSMTVLDMAKNGGEHEVIEFINCYTKSKKENETLSSSINNNDAIKDNLSF